MRKVKTGYGATKYRLDKREKAIKKQQKLAEKQAVRINEIRIAVERHNKVYDHKSLSRYLEETVRLPRLLAAAKEFNIGQDTLVDYLLSKGYSRDDLKPTAKLSLESYIDLIKQFDPERIKAFELDDQGLTVHAEELAISLIEGRLYVRGLKADGSVVWSSGIDTNSGIFLPVFSTYSQLLKEFEELINDEDVTEAAIQQFLERNPEFIKEEEHKEAIPQALIVTEEHTWEADFVLVPLDEAEFCRVTELKLPKVKMERSEKNGHPRFTSQLLHAIQQLKDYAKAFQSKETRKKFQERYGTDIYRPDLQLIIGRKGEFRFKDTFVDKQREEGVRITDWDTFLEKAKRRLS